MSSYRDQNPPKQPAVKISDFVEVEAATEPVIEKFQIIDDEPCYEKPAEMIIVKLGKHRWPWPENKESVNEINSRQMAMLLTGIDFTKMHEELHFEKFA